jgi:predicted dehydrogenase
MFEQMNRRGFLTHQLKVLSAGLYASYASTSIEGAESDPIRIGLIGCGGIMNSHINRIIQNKSPVTFTHVCDIDNNHIGNALQKIQLHQKTVPSTSVAYEEVLDNRDVEAVIIATPHHWHAPIALRAMQAVKDVYLEKPASHCFSEGPLYIKTAKKYKTVFIQGTQMRSSKVKDEAEKLLQSGILGEVKVTKAWNVQKQNVLTPVKDSPIPNGVDYNRWLGPAPSRDFNKNRFHRSWRGYRDYGNGDIGDDGVHDLDMAHWGLDVKTHPNRITAHGSSIQLGGEREYPDNMFVAYHYDEGKVLIYEDRLFTPYGLHGFDSGNAFYGTEGYMIFSRRGYYQVYLGPKEKKGPTVSKEIRGNKGRGYSEHMANFLSCVRTRNQTNCPPELAHHSCSLVHLGEIAYRTQSVLNFDPDTEKFVNNDQANQLLTKEYRKPFAIPETI